MSSKKRTVHSLISEFAWITAGPDELAAMIGILRDAQRQRFGAVKKAAGKARKRVTQAVVGAPVRGTNATITRTDGQAAAAAADEALGTAAK